jgi:hypothetical protein
MTNGTRRGVRDQLHAPVALYPRERLGTQCTGGWVGSRAGLDKCEKISPPLGFDSPTVQPVDSRYTVYEFGTSIYLSVTWYCRWTSDHFMTPLIFFPFNTNIHSLYFCHIAPSKEMQSKVKKKFLYQHCHVKLKHTHEWECFEIKVQCGNKSENLHFSQLTWSWKVRKQCNRC